MKHLIFLLLFAPCACLAQSNTVSFRLDSIAGDRWDFVRITTVQFPDSTSRVGEEKTRLGVRSKARPYVRNVFQSMITADSLGVVQAEAQLIIAKTRLGANRLDRRAMIIRLRP